METRIFKKSWLSPVIFYTILAWTMVCFIGTWFVILQYGIFLEGFIATVMTLFFATMIWAIPFTGLLISDLCFTSGEKPSDSMMFKDLIRKRMREMEEVK